MTQAKALHRHPAIRGGEAHGPVAGRLGQRWDRLGVWASVACAIHCLIAPVLFLVAPTLAGVWSHPSAHALIAVLVLPLAATVLVRGYRAHGKRWVAAAAATGAGFILLGCVMPFLGAGESGAAADACMDCCPRIVSDEAGSLTVGWPMGSILTVFGSVLLIASHCGNLAYCRCCGAGPSA